MSKIRWRNNGLVLTFIAVFIAALFMGSEIAVETIVPTNPTLTINIVRDGEVDDEDVGDDTKVLSSDDSSLILEIEDYIEDKKLADFSVAILKTDYPEVSGRVLLEVAKELRKEKQYKKAVILLSDLLKTDPQNINVMFQLARVQTSLLNTDEAILIYRRLLTIQSSHQLSQINLGLLLMEDGKYVDAIEEFSLAIDTTSGRRKAKSLAARGSCYIELGKYGEAVLDFQKSIQYRPTDSSVWRKLANAQLLNNEDPKIIRETFDRSIALQPDFLQALHDRAMFRWMNQDYDGARSDLEHVSRVAPNYTPSRWTLTYLYLSLDKNQTARKEILVLRKQGVNEKEEIFLQGLENISNEEWDLASSVFESYQSFAAKNVDKSDPNNIDPWVTYFTSQSDFYGSGKYTEKALAKLDSLQTNQWLGTISLMQKSYFLNELGDYEAAIAVLTELQERYSKSPTISYWLGRNLLAANQPEKATEAFKIASRLEKGNSQYKLSLALAYSRSGNIAKSIQNYEELISDHPKHKVGHFNYAVLLSSQEKSQEAIQLYERAIELDPEYTQAKLNLALLHKKQKNYQEAAKLFQDLIDEDPTRKNIRMYLAETWHAQGEDDKALNEIERSLTLDSILPAAHVLKSEILLGQGLVELALNELLILPDEEFSSKPLLTRLYNLGVKLSKADQPALAETAYVKVLSADSGYVKAMVNLSSIYNNSDRHKETVNLLEGKGELLFANEKLLINLVRAYQKLGETKKITALFKLLEEKALLSPEVKALLDVQP